MPLDPSAWVVVRSEMGRSHRGSRVAVVPLSLQTIDLEERAMRIEHHDAIVVGARAAGAATGMLLARAGLDVLVVDRARFGSDTLSTHALMRGAVLQLARWGLLGELLAAGTPMVRRTVVRYGGPEEIVPIRPHERFAGLCAPRRTVLDPILAEGARRAGADVRFGVGVTGLRRDADGAVTGVFLSEGKPGGTLAEVRAPIVIGADGGHSAVARAVGAPVTQQARHSSAFLLALYSGVETDGYQWLYGHAPDGAGRSAGIIPTDGGLVCAWAGVPWETFGGRRPEEHLAETFSQIGPDWWERLAAGRREGPVRAFPGRPGYLRRPWGAGWALVGDAGYFKDPITAHGITDALRDAELLSRAVISAHGDPGQLLTNLTGYEHVRDELSLPFFRIADRVASYRWTMDELRGLLLDMSAAARPEVAHLEALAPDVPVLAGAAA
jgi:flavin-dependent dehydrogenase